MTSCPQCFRMLPRWGTRSQDILHVQAGNLPYCTAVLCTHACMRMQHGCTHACMRMQHGCKILQMRARDSGRSVQDQYSQAVRKRAAVVFRSRKRNGWRVDLANVLLLQPNISENAAPPAVSTATSLITVDVQFCRTTPYAVLRLWRAICSAPA